MKIVVLDATDKLIKAVMSGAAATTNPDFVVSYADHATSAFTEGADDGTLNGTTPVTLVDAPASGVQRVVKEMVINNTDTAAVTIEITYESGANSRRIWYGTLQPNEFMTSDGTFDDTGSLRTAIASIPVHDHSGPSGGGTIPASSIGSGVLLHERGGLEADVSAFNGLVKIASGATTAVTAPAGAIVGDTDTQTLGNKKLTDSTTTFVDNADPTKAMRFEVGGISAGQTRVMTPPNYDGTLATLAGTEAFSAKAITSSTVDSTPVGSTTPAAGKFTTLENTGAYVHNEAGADVDWRAEGDTDQNLLFLDASTDRVGIGTSTPGAKLDVRGTAIFNEDGNDLDFRIEGDADADLFHLDASQDSIGVGVATPDASAKLDIASTTKLFLPPRMTTTQRDAIGSPANGGLLYNSTHKSHNFRIAGIWTALGMATLIARTTLGSDGTFSYSGLSGDFDDLLIRLSVRSDRAATNVDNFYVRCNGDTTAGNYYGNSITLASAFGNTERLGATATGFEIRSGAPAATSPTDYRGVLDFLISNYADSSRPRQCYWVGGVNLADSTGLIAGIIGTGVWKNTSAAVSQISAVPVNGTNFKSGSTISIWGIKAAA